MRARQLGQQMAVPELGLGCMGMSQSYGLPDDEESIATIHRAIEIGVCFLDTSDSYGPHTNELLVGRAIKGHRDEVILATKFGQEFRPDGTRGVNGRPEYVRQACDRSLQRLGVDHIDLYYQHRVDPQVPVEETWGALSGLVQAGKVTHLGISEAAPQTLRRAHAVHPITAGQYEYSLFSRDREAELLPLMRELGIGMVCYSPLGRGLLTGALPATDELTERDFRRRHPRFQGEALAHNLAIAARIAALAAAKGVTPAQLALAWVLAQGSDLVPIPGTKRRVYLDQNAAATQIELTGEELHLLDEAAPAGAAAGDRYPPESMALIDG